MYLAIPKCGDLQQCSWAGQARQGRAGQGSGGKSTAKTSQPAAAAEKHI